jgi:phosphatidylethanolamine-binding protein (PEBP) family uncharacterized protein
MCARSSEDDRTNRERERIRQQSSDIRQEPEPARARLDPRLRGIPEAVEPPFEGRNDFGRVGYAGPCPPVGHPPHEYVFRLVALGMPPDFPPGSRMDDLREFLAEELIEAIELTGTFVRPPRPVEGTP